MVLADGSRPKYLSDHAHGSLCRLHRGPRALDPHGLREAPGLGRLRGGLLAGISERKGHPPCQQPALALHGCSWCLLKRL